MKGGRWPVGGGEMARRIRGHDWAATPLGPIEAWPRSLKTAVEMVLAMPGPATILWGPSHVQLYNDAYVAIARDRHPALLGRPAAENWPDAYGGVIAPLLEAVGAGRSTELAEYPVALRAPDGRLEERVFDTAFAPVRDEGGGVAGALQTLVEVTDRKRAEAALEESEARYRAFVTASSDVVYRMGPDWSEMRQLDGRGFLSDTAAPREAWIDDYIHPDDQPTVRAAIDRAVRDKRMFELEHRVLQADGILGWTLSRAIPILNEDGEITEWLGAASDVTTRKEAELALRENEQRQAFLLELSDRLRLAADPQAAMSAAAEMFGRRIGVAVAHYVLFHPDEDSYDIAASYSDGRLPPHLAEGSGRLSTQGPGWGPQFRSGEAVFSDDHDTRPTADAEASRASGIRSGSAVPLIWDGRLVAIFSTAHPEPRRWTESEKALQIEVAERTWAAVERARAEAALRQSEARLHLALDAAELCTFMWHVPEDRAEADARLLAHFGLPPDGTISLAEALATLIHPDDVPHHAAAVARALDPAGPGTLREEYRVRRPDGRERWIAVSGTTEFEGTPRAVVRMAGVIADVTERKRAEEAVRESEERYRVLVENVGGHAVFMLDAEGYVTEWTGSAERVKGYPAEEVIGRHFSVFSTPEQVEAGDPGRELAEAAQTGRAEREGWRVKKGGGRIWVNEIATAVRDAEGHLLGFAKIARDLTERRELEEERERARTRELTAMAEAAERERISRELHDRVAHHMGVAHQSLELFAALREAAPRRAGERLNLARESTRAALDQTRALSAELKRLQEEELEGGMGAALRALGATMSDGVPVEVSVSGDDSGVPAPVALQAYLAMREAVRNAIRHSGCSRVGVDLEVRDGEVIGTVEDDGKGFDPEAVGRASPSWGVGLRSMRERAEMLGGGLRVDSAPGRGTRVEVRVPLDGRRP